MDFEILPSLISCYEGTLLLMLSPASHLTKCFPTVRFVAWSVCGLSVQGFNSVASAHEDLFTENGTRAVCTRTEFRAEQLHQLPMEDRAQVAYPNLLPYF